MSNTHTNLVLKKPKTDSSIRKVWIPKTVAYILREWRDIQDQYKDFLGRDYYDYNLVLTLPNGRPVENRTIDKEFKKLREKANLPSVVFHSLRHSSTTYKLKLNHGDLKATQGDTGHSQIDMITDVYAHILDEDRRKVLGLNQALTFAISTLGSYVLDRNLDDWWEGVTARFAGKRVGDPDLEKKLKAINDEIIRNAETKFGKPWKKLSKKEKLKIEELTNEVNKYRDMYLRTLAETENFKKRVNEEIENIRK